LNSSFILFLPFRHDPSTTAEAKQANKNGLIKERADLWRWLVVCIRSEESRQCFRKRDTR
jgi:hypothetical protein